MCLGSNVPLMLGGYFCIAVFGLQFLGGIFNYYFEWNFFLLVTGMTILHPTDEDNINDEGIIHDEVIRNNEESHHH